MARRKDEHLPPDMVSPPANPLASFADGELQAELRRREDERDREAIRLRTDHLALVAHNAKLLIDVLQPKHTHRNSTDCDRACPLCLLNEAVNCGYIPEDIEFRLKAEENPLRDPDNPRGR